MAQDDIKVEDIVTPVPTSETTVVEETTKQDPLKTELERVQSTGRTEKEKAEFSLKKNAERVKALGGDIHALLGVEQKVLEDEDDKPITRGEWKKMQQETANKSALQLAEEISNETERELAKWHLENTIKSTGNASQDLELALNQVNAVKNKQILAEVQRKGTAKTHSTASSAPIRTTEPEAELSKDELAFMQPPFNLTREEIIKTRKVK